MPDAQFFVDLLKQARDAGLMPFVWIVLAAWTLIRFPKLREWLLKERTVTAKGSVSGDTDKITIAKRVNGFVLREDCHSAMNTLRNDIAQVHGKMDETKSSVDELAGYIKGKFDRKRG